MSDIGTPITATIPAVGTTGTSYATQINAFLTEVRARLEAKVPLTSILAGLLDMVNNAIENVQYLLLYPQDAAPTEPVGSLQNANGDLYWVSPSGTAQITDGDQVNSAGIGGITGDYGGVNPAQLRFDDGDATYTFYDDFVGGDLATTRQVGVEIANTGDTAAVTLDWGGSSSYTATLPTAAPAAQAILQMEADGDIVATNTFPTNTNITLAGTGKIVHGTRKVAIPIEAFRVTSGTVSDLTTVSGLDLTAYVTASSSAVFYIKLPMLESNCQLQSFEVVSTAGSAIGLTLASEGGFPFGAVDVPFTTSDSTSGGQRKSTCTITTPFVPSSGTYYILKINNISSSVDYYSITANYTVPA